MFSLNPMKELYESPLPPMALTDYEAFSKFLNQALHCCHETGRDFNVYLDWAIRALASSMAADSAARIFLPKTRTAPFSLDDLIPLSEIPSKGTVRVDLTKSYVVAPIWNNTDLVVTVKGGTAHSKGRFGVLLSRPFIWISSVKGHKKAGRPYRTACHCLCKQHRLVVVF